MKNIVGIDLGTTFSALAALDDSGKPNVVAVDGERILPSCVWAPKGAPEPLRVGALAKAALGTEPESVASRFKRHMGSDANLSLKYLGRSVTPVEASAVVLRKLVQEANKVLQTPIDEVVITVPANFADRQRRATIEAGEKAGLKVLNIINEPTAAALAYATQHNVNGTVLIYDMGGGTFDVTIANINGTDVQCLTSEGDIDLGGIDFDSRLAGLVDALHENTHGVSLRKALGLKTPEEERDSTVWQSLLLECEKWKKTLSSMPSVTVKFLESPKGKVEGTITREQFVSSIAGYIAKSEMLVETALDNAKLKPEQIDSVLLVGGSTRIPAVRNSIKKLIGKEPLEAVNVDEAVALGAAIYAGIRTDKSKLTPLQQQRLGQVAVKDVSTKYYGTIILDFNEHIGEPQQAVSILIKKDTPLPCSTTERFSTTSDGQQFINCRVTESAQEETNPDFVEVVFEERLGPLPAGRSAGRPVEVTYSYNHDQTMQVKFVDVESGLILEDVLKMKADSAPSVSIPKFKIA